MNGEPTDPALPIWALFGSALAGPTLGDERQGRAFQFIGLVADEIGDNVRARLIAQMQDAGWHEIEILSADPLSPDGIVSDESLMFALKRAQKDGCAWVVHPIALPRHAKV